jgi:hypothetical protein
MLDERVLVVDVGGSEEDDAPLVCLVCQRWACPSPVGPDATAASTSQPCRCARLAVGRRHFVRARAVASCLPLITS